MTKHEPKAQIEEPVDGVFQCVDCGAYAWHDEKKIVHHETCVPGEAKRWASA